MQKGSCRGHLHRVWKGPAGLGGGSWQRQFGGDLVDFLSFLTGLYLRQCLPPLSCTKSMSYCIVRQLCCSLGTTYMSPNLLWCCANTFIVYLYLCFLFPSLYVNLLFLIVLCCACRFDLSSCSNLRRLSVSGYETGVLCLR